MSLEFHKMFFLQQDFVFNEYIKASIQNIILRHFFLNYKRLRKKDFLQILVKETIKKPKKINEITLFN